MVLFTPSVFADDGIIDWSKIIIAGNYNSSTDILTLSASLSDDTGPREKYTLGIEIDGKLYRKEFEYNTQSKKYTTVFTHKTSSLKTSYPFTLSVKDAQYNERYKSSSVLSFQNSSTGTGTTGTGSTGTWATGTGSASSSNDDIANRVITMIFEDMPVMYDTTGERIKYIDSQLVVLRGYLAKYPERKTLIELIIHKLESIRKTLVDSLTSGTGSTTWTGTTIPPRTWYIPLYKNRASEPLRINGIGNNPNYKSWRAQN